MSKSIFQAKPSSFAKHRCLCTIISVILIYCVLSWTFTNSRPNYSTLSSSQPINTTDCSQIGSVQFLDRIQEPGDQKTFYDDPGTHYTIDKPMMDWDEKRREWLNQNPSFATGIEDRMLVVSGSQSSPCEFPTGDHMMLRLFKNKVDYCRINGYGIFYNNAYLDPKMRSCWAKIPLVRAAMVAHPEAEWIFWVDSDAIFTDMEFKIPFERFKDYNFVVNGYPKFIFEEKSWLGLNAGVFLIRNCQWSMDFLDVWASLGPRSPDYEKWGKIQQSIFKDKAHPESDDQSALVYLVLKEKEKWGERIHIQNEYSINAYWLDTVEKFDNISKKYVEMEKGDSRLRRRHAEAASERYAADEGELQKLGGWRRPFITHFAGCQPCNGAHGNDPAFQGDTCWVGIERALNFADNQVLRSYGFVHPDLRDGSSVKPVPFDYPRNEI